MLQTAKKSKGKSAAVFRLKDEVLGSKKNAMEPVIINDPDTDEPIHSPEKIKEASLKYCKNLLTNREPKPAYKEAVRRKEKLHEERMVENIENDCEELSFEMFSSALKKVSNKHKSRYQFILNAGKSLINALFFLYSTVWKKEVIPDTWHDSLLIQLPKGKPNLNNLDNIRHIHLKEIVPSLFGQIITLHAKDTLIDNMSKFQIATKPGHRATEHLYVILSIIESSEQKKKAQIITMYDLSKYFDRESLHDCCSEVYANKVKGKVYRLLFLMNKSIRIRVKTPVGVTPPCDTGPGMGQGTSEGAIISAVNLDNGVRFRFHKTSAENEEENEVENEEEKEEENEDENEEESEGTTTKENADNVGKKENTDTLKNRAGSADDDE